MATSNGLIRTKQDEIAFLTKYIASLETDLTKPEYALPGYQKELLTRIAASKEQLAGVEAAVAEAPAVAAAQPTASSTSSSSATPVAPGPGTTGTVEVAAAPPKAGAPVSENIPRVEVNGVGNKPVSKEDPAAGFRVEVNGVGPLTIIPQPNVLDKFNSYTYQASVYLLSPTQYIKFQAGNRIIPASQLLFQSGGKQAGTGNKFFDNDFYIDSITLETAISGKQTQGAHMATDIKFTVTEPMGITLLDRLKNAVKAMQPSGASNWSTAHYLMTISFFGYDQTGALVTPGTPAIGNVAANPKAVTIKYIPFLISGVNWSVGNHLVNYEFTGSPIGQITAGSSKIGQIKFPIEITALTVDEFINGKSTYTAVTTSAADPGQSTTAFNSTGGGGANSPANASAAPYVIEKTPSRGGLQAALNRYAQLVKEESNFEFQDEYEFVFVNATDIQQSKLKSPQPKIDKKVAAMGAAASQYAQNLNSATVPVSQDQVSISIAAGTSIVKALDQVIRNSQYIVAQASSYDNSDGDTLPISSQGKPPTWFQISYSAVPLQFDNMRKDYAYKMRYTITKYSIPNFHSTYFPASTAFPGLHKQYKYWFTGENKSVLDYSANFDGLYNLTVSGVGNKSAQDTISSRNSASTNDLYRDDTLYAIKLGYYPRSTQSTGSGSGATNEGSANAAEYLYSPATQGSSRIRIVGDPGWIQQGSLVFPIESADFQKETEMGFLADGTVSFDAGQILYEIAWQRPEDYDLNTGLADPYAKTFAKYGEREALQSNIYQAVKVISEFRSGRFEQTIEGSICIFTKVAPLNNYKTVVADNTPVQNQRTNASTVSQAATFGGTTNPSLAASSASLTAPASNSSGTIPAPASPPAITESNSNTPSTTPEQFAATDQTRQPLQDVPNIVPALPSTPATSNGQTIGGYGFGTVVNSPPVLTVGAGRTSLDALQSAAVNTPPYLTRRDP